MTQELIVPVDDLSTVLLPEDHELAPCEVCDNRAAWYIRCADCHRITMICDPHRIEAEQECAAMPPYQWFECTTCAAVYPRPLVWTRL